MFCEQLELGLAADERRRERRRAAPPCSRAQRRATPRRGSASPRRSSGPSVLDLDAAEREPVRAGADQDLARLRGLLEAGGDVDGLAGGEGRVGVVGDDLARLDADPRLEAELVDGVEDRERRADRALGVVLVRRGNAEGGHDRVARELLDDAAVRVDAVRDAGRRTACTRRRTTSGSVAGDERGRVDEIDEQDGGELAFHASSV